LARFAVRFGAAAQAFWAAAQLNFWLALQALEAAAAACFGLLRRLGLAH
jgi:hypothetical protein